MQLHQSLIALALVLGASCAHAAVKPCKELEAEVAAKLDAKAVKGYELTVLDADKVGAAAVVGSCEGGSKKLTLVRK